MECYRNRGEGDRPLTQRVRGRYDTVNEGVEREGGDESDFVGLKWGSENKPKNGDRPQKKQHIKKTPPSKRTGLFYISLSEFVTDSEPEDSRVGDLSDFPEIAGRCTKFFCKGNSCICEVEAIH